MKITFCPAKFYALLTSSLVLSQLCCLFGSELPAFSATADDTEVIQIGDSVDSGAEKEALPAKSGDSGLIKAGEDAVVKDADSGVVAAAKDGGVLSTAADSGSGSAASAAADSDGVTKNTEVSTEKEAPLLPDAQKSLLQKPTTIVLKPGEKLNITGFSEEKEATVADLKSAVTNPEYHRVQMRISGSMCFACLHTFEEKLKQVYGIERVKINRAAPSIQSVSPDLSNWADAVIFYDATLLSMADMRAYIKTNGYFSYRVLDKPADSLPIEEPKPLKK